MDIVDSIITAGAAAAEAAAYLHRPNSAGNLPVTTDAEREFAYA
jgi:hypothetical protein